MIQTILRVNRAAIYTEPEVGLDAVQVAMLEGFLRRRLRGEPLQYILGTVEFRTIVLHVDRRALIPRPETEFLVEIGLELIGSILAPLVLDVGTGCGAIALSILDDHPGARSTGIDISEEALELAKENSGILKLNDRVTWKKSDLYADNFIHQFDSPFDLIISNPPYVSERDFERLPPEIRLFEPRVALTPGEDGLQAIRRLAEVCPRILKSRGHYVGELGEDQGEAAKQIFEKAGWDAHVRRDLSGKPRYLVASLPENR